jgi:ligand-binding sensor domain-containing protein
MKRIIFLLVCLINCNISIAQVSISKTLKIEIKKGAKSSNNFVSHLLTDKLGHVWFTTPQGIYCFDGNLFTNFSIMPTLKEAYVYDVMQDKTGNVWFATDDGVYKYDGKTLAKFSLQNVSNWFLNLFGNYNNQSASNQNNVKPNEVRKIMQDKDGNIWFGVVGPTVYRYDGKDITPIKVMSCKDDNDLSYGINTIYQDTKGNIWFSNGGCGLCHGLYRLEALNAHHPCITGSCKHDISNANDVKNHEEQIHHLFVEVKTNGTKNHLTVCSILEDKKGNIWFAVGDSGVFKWDGKVLVQISGINNFNKSFVMELFEDSHGNIWMPTGESGMNIAYNNGVFMYDGKEVKQVLKRGGFSPANTNTILEDNDRRIWFTDGFKGGVYCYDGSKFINTIATESLQNKRITSIAKDNNGNLWFGSNELGMYKFDGKKIICFSKNE